MKIATIGTGWIVKKFIQACERNSDVEVTHMYTRKKENAQELAKTFHIPNICTDLETFWKEDFDVVYIASPNALHYTYAKQALQANKHVMCEKPLVSSLQEFDELVELAKEHERIFFEAITLREAPNYIMLKEYIKDVEPVHIAQVNFFRYSPAYDELKQGQLPNVFNPQMQGGVLADMGIYCIHFLVGLFGVPNKTQYFPNMYENSIDTSGVIVLTYDHMQATSLIAKDATALEHNLIAGENGVIEIPKQASRCTSFSVTKKDGETISPSIEQDDNNMIYELAKMVTLFHATDDIEYLRLLQESRNVIQTYEMLRTSTNLL